MLMGVGTEPALSRRHLASASAPAPRQEPARTPRGPEDPVPTIPAVPGRAGAGADPELAALRDDYPQWLIKRTTLAGYAFALVRGATSRFARDVADVHAIIGGES